jgi:Transposase DDE domain group 1
VERTLVLKTVCDLCPEDEDALSSQPTLSRFENAVSGRMLNQLRQQLEESYVQGLPANTQVVVLDIDSTDDETHGQQQLTFFHGFYDQHMYHPLLVFDGESGELVSVLLRPGNAHAARSAKPLLCGIIRRIKARFPRAQILVRADGGFCVPRLLEELEKLQREFGDVDYIIGIAKNPRLLALAETTMAEARRRYEETGRHVRHFSACQYAAETWSHERHVIIKAEHGTMGANPRFVVTTLDEFDAKLLYDVGYCARGRCENFIKDLKNALAGDRLSCGRYLANFFRLLLHAAAYRLLHAVRTAAVTVAPELGRAQFDTIRLRLLKVAAYVTQSVRRILVHLPRSFPFATAFRALAGHLARPAPA